MNTALTTASSMTSANTTTSASPKSEASGASALSSDFETFLKMLTVQMQNQDPLNPIESSDYALQLATFSGVEQQVLTNDMLSSLSSQLGVIGMAQIAGWVGMEARSEAPVQFSGSPVTLSPVPDKSADQVSLIVRDSGGEIVQTAQIGLSSDSITWAGVDERGTPFPHGVYSFQLENHANGEILSTTPVEAYGRVIEARAEGGETVLVLEGGATVTSESISALREPE